MNARKEDRFGHSVLVRRLQVLAIGPEQQPSNRVETEDRIAR